MGVVLSTRNGVSPSVLLAGLVLVLALSGCATYSDSFGVIQHNLASQQYDEALKSIEKQSDSKTDHVLYLLNKGMVLRMKRDFADSNQALEAAKGEMERLYAASVSEHTLSFLVNDATVSYGGEDFEQVLVHLYMALNYLELGQLGEARVEAMQVDLKLREIGEKVSGSKFTEDAFSRYLTGMIYEELGEWSDAMISYREAYEAYKKYQANYGMLMPDMLKYDLLRLSRREGLKDEAAQYRKEFGITLAPDEDSSSKQGELVFVLNNGLAPIKRERAVNMFDPIHRIMVRIALPYYESRPNNVTGARISAVGNQASAELMENIDAIARQSLDSHMAAITARSIARAATKTTLIMAEQRRNDRSNNPVPGLLGVFATQVAAVTTERADTRSWLTLPANIQVARLPLPPGEYTIKVELVGAGGETVAIREYPKVVITGAHKTYLTQHWTPPIQPSTVRR